MIRQLCEQMNMSVSELARRLGQSPQNFGKKLKRETITLEECLHWTREYLERAKQAFAEAGGTYTLSKSEEKVADFDANIQITIVLT